MYSPLSALFMLLTAQNLPHMEQLSSYSGALPSRIRFAVSGSMAHSHCFSQSKVRQASAMASSRSLAWGTFLAISAAWAAILEAIMPCLTSSTLGRARCSAGVT